MSYLSISLCEICRNTELFLVRISPGLNPGLNPAKNDVFCHFVEFGSKDFLEIECNDGLRQFLTSHGSKTLKNIFGAQIWAKRTKIGLRVRFFAIFSSLVH